MVAKYGVYSFELEPGDYLIKASYYQNSTLIYSASETVKIKGEGSYVLDLLLLPVYSEELMDTSELKETSGSPAADNSSDTVQKNNNSGTVNNIDADSPNDNNASTVEIDSIETNGPASFTGYYPIAALMLFLLLAGGYRFRKQRSPDKNDPEHSKLRKVGRKTDMEIAGSEIRRQEKSQLQAEKAGYETEKNHMPVSEPGSSIKLSTNAEPKTGQELPIELAEIQLSEKSDLEVRKEKEGEDKGNTEGQLIPEPEDTGLRGEIEKGKETSSEEPSRLPETTQVSEPETPVKKNLPLPADLQEIMDIIRGQGGRITQKDLRSKLKYSEGKVSLMLADLERRELIEKFKRGRGNVVILRDLEK
ncbi:MAG TPA: hypothetical protein HA306_01905 [Methanosarcina sp.]|nr:hypothetical protein [Methanosarcina sp.]